MKTKKLIWAAILIVSLGTFTTGCGKENDNKETVELQIIEENQLSQLPIT
ncbi:hypothetical protein [Alkaliphilus hydrothermalis]|uniref:Uncharacterized protein n=1 Tax=Alkaliphilus hydrothermalis TaxID=1482730 RepID=A0ABS2NPQ9_9FIRM|nr:hypothetical protein [Alkaliphilus hydrothermalis]MBM7614923.1 hypothetical protein [Alkaliphilus hydrothermalis]